MPAALDAGVADVPGSPFYSGPGGANGLRLSFSDLDKNDLAEAAARLASVLG